MSQYANNTLTPSVAAGMGRCAFFASMTEAQLIAMFRAFGHTGRAAIVQCAVKSYRRAEAEHYDARLAPDPSRVVGSDAL